jgi:hypothetical protein
LCILESKKESRTKLKKREEKKEKEEKKERTEKRLRGRDAVFSLLEAGSVVHTLLPFLFLSFSPFNLVNLSALVASSIITCCAL